MHRLRLAVATAFALSAPGACIAGDLVCASLHVSASPVQFAPQLIVEPLTPVDIYILADFDWAPEQDRATRGITAWEASLELPSPENWYILEVELFPGGSVDLASQPLDFVVALAGGQVVTQPDPGLPLVLARMRLSWAAQVAPPNIGTIDFGPAPTSSFPSNPRPAWVDDEDALHDFDRLTGAYINMWDASSSSSFGSYKAAGGAANPSPAP